MNSMMLPMMGVLLVLILTLGIVAVMMMRKSASHQKRVESIIRGQRNPDQNDPTKEKKAQDKRRADIAQKLKDGEEGQKNKKKTPMSLRLQQAGMTISVKQFWLFSVILCVVLVLLSTVMGADGFVIVMMGIIGVLGSPRFVVGWKRKRRIKKFLEEFADCLEAMVRLLKAGMPITEAISMSAREFGGPIGEEMSRIYDAQKIGIPLAEAALSAAQRMPITEMQMLATGLSIQAQTGASLSEVLMNLAGVIRARYRLKRKIQAMSSEAKASAMIIGALPILVGGGLAGINPEYIGLLFNTGIGKVLLVACAVWMGMGIFVMKIMINFRV
jgi:tight adherence protein B